MDGYVDEDASKSFNEALKKPAWDDWLFKDTESRAALLQLNTDFQSQVQDIRYKYAINPKKYRTKAAAQKWLETDYVKIKKEWDGYITFIMYHAHLMPGWRSAINLYVLTDKFFTPPAILIHDTPDDHGFPNLRLQINDQMSQQDLSKLLKHIRLWIEMNAYKRRQKRMPYDYLPFYLLFYELREAGLGNDEIAESMQANLEGRSDIGIPTITTTFVRNSLKWLDAQIKTQMS